jgi:hypothetical protein
MTTSITTRAGKGSELTWNEVDANFTNLKTTADAAAVLTANTFTGSQIIAASSLTLGTAVADAADFILKTIESPSYHISSVSSDFGTYYDNTLQIGYNCRGGSVTDASDIAWYLQWENKYLSGSDYLAEFHLNYKSADGGNNRRIFSADINRATHATSFGFTTNAFYVHNDASVQMFDITSGGLVGINKASPVATLDVLSADAAKPALLVQAHASQSQDTFHFRTSAGDNFFRALSGTSNWGKIYVTAPTGQASGASIYIQSINTSKQIELNMDGSGNSVIRCTGPIFYDYSQQLYFRDVNAGYATVASILSGEATISPAVNKIGLILSGTSLTGATATEVLSMAGTWNTSGTPTAIKLNITDTASNAASKLVDLQVGAASVFKVSKNGDVASSNATNGQSIGIKSLTELLTIAAAATSTTTIQKPANSIILGVSVRVTTAVTCTSTFTVGDSGSATRFSTAAVSKAINSTDKGTAAGAYYNATAEGIVITPDTTPSDATGRVRVTIHYIEVTPPTS